MEFFFFHIPQISVLGLHDLPKWLAYLISIIAMLLAALVAQLVVVPWQKRKILNMDEEGTEGDGLASSSALKVAKNKQIVHGLFDFLQVLSAVFTSFAHGGEF